MAKLTAPPKACAWIEGDPRAGAKPCGARAVTGKPYCHSHLERAYSPQSFRKLTGSPIRRR